MRRSSIVWVRCLLPLLVLLLPVALLVAPAAPAAAAGQQLSLDPTFGEGGVARSDLRVNEDVTVIGMHLFPDGSSLVAGVTEDPYNNADEEGYRSYRYSLALMRYTPDGWPDPSFGVAGRVLATKYTTTEEEATERSITLQPDGRILVAGATAVRVSYRQSYLAVRVARYLPDGSPDPSFGTGGQVRIPGEGHADSLVLLPDGKILLAGSFEGDMALFQLNADGSADLGFGNAGVVRVNVAVWSSQIDHLVQLPDGSLLVGTDGQNHSSYRKPVVARLTAAGQLDPGFGVDGVFTLTLSERRDTLQAVLPQPDGRILLVGTTQTDTPQSALALVRLEADGQIDPSFGSDGVALFGQEGLALAAGTAQLQPDGGMVVTGTATGAAGSALLLARFTPEGRLDPAFGGTGLGLIDRLGLNQSGSDLAIAADGTLVVAGTDRRLGTSLLLARYTRAGALDHSFGDHGLRVDRFPISSKSSGGLVARDAEGRVLAVQDTHGGHVLTRTLSNGHLDPSFGNQGIVYIGDDTWCGGNSPNWFEAVLVQRSGRIILTASSEHLPFNFYRHVCAEAYLPNGHRDTSFYLESRYNTIAIQDIQLLPDDRLLLITTTWNHMEISLFTSDGTHDPTFGSNGIIQIASTPTDLDWGASGQAVSAPDGSIIVFSRIDNYAEPVAAFLARYRPDGTLDPTFGEAGRRALDPDRWLEIAEMLILPSGKLLALVTMPEQWSLARFDTDGALDPSYGDDGLLRLPRGGAVLARDVRPGSIRLLLEGPTLLQLDAEGRPDAGAGPGGMRDIAPEPLDSIHAGAFLPDGLVLSGTLDGMAALARYRQGFPTTAVLDRFDRRPGLLGVPWVGPGLKGYLVAKRALRAGAGGPLYWRRRYGDDQAVALTLTTIAPAGRYGLLLKVESHNDVVNWRYGAIRALYDAGAGQVRVETYQRPQGWRVVAAAPASFADGDQLGARARADGTVLVYRNGAELLRADTTVTNGSFFAAGAIGRVGLWFEGAAGAVVDDLAGGTTPAP